MTDPPLTAADLDRIEAELRTMPRSEIWTGIRDSLIRRLVREVRRLRARLAEVEALRAEEQGLVRRYPDEPADQAPYAGPVRDLKPVVTYSGPRPAPALRSAAVHGLQAAEYDETTSTWTFEVVEPPTDGGGE
jgi:hypothetical protein